MVKDSVLSVLQSVLQVGDLIGIAPRGYNHGCRDYAIVRFLGGRRAEVVEAQSCHSCWQVGHTRSHVFARVGEVWWFQEGFRVRPTEAWSADVKWELD